ncbi:MAG: methyltransferase domain-containing protein [Sulfuricellaceae bacterium]
MSWDPVWEKVFSSQAWGKYPGEDLIRFVARNFYGAPDRSAVKLLEVGCGPGANLWFMAREGFTVYGIEGSQTAVDQARARLDAECPGWKGQLWCGDMGRIPMEDGFFDAVIDNEAVYCNAYETSRHIYQEMARVTRKGGKLFARTFAQGSWGSDTGEKLGHNAWRVAEGPLLNKGYARFTNDSEIEDLFQGFGIQEVELLTRTMANRTHEVKEWVILGEKV